MVFTFFTKKNRRKNKNRTRKKGRKKVSKKVRKKPRISDLYYTRKITDTSFPYLPITKGEAVDEFLRMKNCNNLNPKSLIGNKTVDYGTYRMRVKTKYRGKSWFERWKDVRYRNKLKDF